MGVVLKVLARRLPLMLVEAAPAKDAFCESNLLFRDSFA